MASEGQAEYWTFPTNPDEFDQDERISFSRLDNKYIAVQDDGTEYEWDAGLKRWIPIVDEELIAQQQSGYVVPGAEAEQERSQPTNSGQGKKRKNGPATDREVSRTRMKQTAFGYSSESSQLARPWEPGMERRTENKRRIRSLTFLSFSP